MNKQMENWGNYTINMSRKKKNPTHCLSYHIANSWQTSFSVSVMWKIAWLLFSGSVDLVRVTWLWAFSVYTWLPHFLLPQTVSILGRLSYDRKVQWFWSIVLTKISLWTLWYFKFLTDVRACSTGHGELDQLIFSFIHSLIHYLLSALCQVSRIQKWQSLGASTWRVRRH